MLAISVVPGGVDAPTAAWAAIGEQRKLVNVDRPRFIGIAGGSCSGKTALARGLSETLGSDACSVISTDSYYIGLPGATPEEIEDHNFDNPEALEHDALARDLATLALGYDVRVPVYDFKTHTRTDDVMTIGPTEFVIVEGLFTLHWDDVRKRLDTRVFIDVSHEKCLARRIERDMRDRGRPRDEILRRYETMARPMYEGHVLPSRHHANVIVDGARPIDECVEMVLRAIEQAGT
jgi:uridine kinase